MLAHDAPDRVAYLVLINAVGGAKWQSWSRVERTLAERPLWDFALRFGRELWPPRQGLDTVLAVQAEATRNVLTNPFGVWTVADLARRADLTEELAELGRRGLPVLALSSTGDGIIPRPAFEALCHAMGAAGRVVPGHHSWLLTDPDAFGEVLHNVLEVAEVDVSHGRRSATRAELHRLLATTDLPAPVARDLVGSAAPL